MFTLSRGRHVAGLSAVCGLCAALWLTLPCLTLTDAPPAEAFSCRPALIPNGKVVDERGCVNCHISEFGGGPRNAFGILIDEFAQGCNAFWNEGIAREDSDGDGRTNGEELNDPDGEWRPGDADPGDPATVTNPGIGIIFKRGDGDVSGAVDISDPIFNLSFQFIGGLEPRCKDALDVDDSGTIDVSDPIANLTSQFLGGEIPAPGLMMCGEDPTADELDCADYPQENCDVDS